MSTRTRTVRKARRSVIPDAQAHRVPPGQIITPRWPVLHQGDVHPFEAETWVFRVWGEVAAPSCWTWSEFQTLPTVSIDGDLHCVTRWSSLGHTWTGVRPRTICEVAGVSPLARFILFHGEGGYTANIPIDVFLSENVVLATHHDGQPLTPEHGAPVRAIVTDRYGWKSVKWLRGIEFLAEDRPGFWEGFGYHNSADPWREERFES